MKRLCLALACVASAAVWTQASAEKLSPDPLRSPRPHHAAKARHAAPIRSASRDDLRFSDPYAPPEGTTYVRQGGFPVDPYPAPIEPTPRLSISMQKDGAGHTTGGFGWNF
jgi:hypothetical protein